MHFSGFQQPRMSVPAGWGCAKACGKSITAKITLTYSFLLVIERRSAGIQYLGLKPSLTILTEQFLLGTV